jgi:hypothetical protein
MKTTYNIWLDNLDKEEIIVEHGLTDSGLEEAYQVYCDNNNLDMEAEWDCLNMEVINEE